MRATFQAELVAEKVENVLRVREPQDVRGFLRPICGCEQGGGACLLIRKHDQVEARVRARLFSDIGSRVPEIASHLRCHPYKSMSLKLRSLSASSYDPLAALLLVVALFLHRRDSFPHALTTLRATKPFPLLRKLTEVPLLL